MSIAERDWQAATAAISGAQQAVISCHLHPDGDALGSALALHGALVKAGRPALVSFSEPFGVAAQYRFLPGVERLTPPGQVPPEPELMVCFDTGSLDRLGSLAGIFKRARRTLVIDHHASNTRFGEINLIDPAAPASAVLCRELLRRLDLPLDEEIATNLYTALVTDTGRFQYQSTVPETHLLAAELLAAGVQQYEVAKAVFETNDIRYLRLLSRLLDRVTQAPEASLVWASVTLEDLRAYGLGMEATEGLIDLVRTDGASDVAAVLKEQPDGGFKVSLRSKGGTNVAEVAGRFGGGGHALASGFTSTRDSAGTIEALVQALEAQRAGADGQGPSAGGDGTSTRETSSTAASGR
jgi:bifunctional oligoribonuclease and PAP phosphatase NrnA